MSLRKNSLYFGFFLLTIAYCLLSVLLLVWILFWL